MSDLIKEIVNESIKTLAGHHGVAEQEIKKAYVSRDSSVIKQVNALSKEAYLLIMEEV